MDQHQPGSYTVFPLSLSQQNIWALEQTCPGTPINNISTTLRIRGRVDLPVLQQCIDLVLASDSSLRTQIVLRDGLPMQIQTDFVQTPFPVYDFTQTSAEGVESWETAVTREAMPLLDAPLYRFILFRTGEQEGGLLMKLHHLISDGWTQILLCNRISQAYLDLLAGKQPALEPSPSYEAHVKEEAKYLASSAYRRDEAYWSSVLEQAGEASVLKSVKSAAVSPVGSRRSFALPQSLNNDIYTFCAQNRVAPFSVLYLALAIYFKRIGGADRFTIGVPIFNRTNFVFKQTSGMFVSTLPFFNEIQGEWSLSECTAHLNERWLEMLRHQRLPFTHIQRLAQKQGSGSGRLFNIALSYQNGQMLASRDASVEFSGRWHYSGYQMEQLCIHLSNLQDGRRYAIDYDYLTQIFSEQEIEKLHECLTNILRESLRHPDKPISQLSVLSAQEQEKVLYTFNRTDTPLYDEDVYHRFAAAVERHPNRAALICRGERVTYRQLEQIVRQVHAALEKTGGETALAAVLLPREPALMAALMGILRAGWAFVILPPDLPVNRMREILRQSGAAALLTTEPVRTAAGLDTELPMVDMTALPPETQSEPVVSPEALAYVVYTSGSTGTPKGVEVSRRSLLNLSAAMAPIYGKGAVLSMCSIGFDAFMLESVAALLNAQTILLPEDGDLESPGRLAELIAGYGVGFLSTTPSRLAALLKHPAFRKAMRRMESIVCGGEAFSGDLLRSLRLSTEARVYNQYGPSETTVAVSLKQLNQASAITVGAPMANCRLYVLDQWMNPLPIGVYGDLYVGGLCVGLGYRGRPDLTEQSFLESPFVLGERIYRTGDVACWTPEGEIQLGGRADRQVKLRGLRVEPQEVSACLCTHPQVKESAVRVLEYEGQTILAAYYTSDIVLPEEELRSFAASYLPQYMVPAVILRVERIPLTANGKVDESALPMPAPSSGGASAPSGELERTLLAIFSQVLGRSDLGAESDYFLCGGNSLNAMETISRIGEETGRSVRIADLYACRTPRHLAALMGGAHDTAEAIHLRPAPKLERYPLTPTQQGLYVQSFMDPTGTAYQMPGAFRLGKAPDILRLQRAFRDLIAGEPLLRTAFVQESDGIFARVQDEVPFDLAIVSGSTFESACQPLLRPFQLDRAPLLRATLWEKNGTWTLLLNIHHIIGDGMSTPVLLRRLDALYQGAAPQDQALSYLDYAWQRSQEERDASRLDYWKQHLTPLPESMELPADLFRSRQFDYLGQGFSFALSESLSAACDAFCAKEGISAFMFFLAAYGILLSRLSGKEDLMVGAPSAGRLLPETREMCGPFINTLPLRLRPAAEARVGDYLRAVRDEVNGMLDHQQVGLEEIVGALDLPRSLSQSPLYQVMFSQRPLDAEAFTLDGAPLGYRPIPTGTAKMELVMELAREGDHYTFQVEYASSVFERGTVDYWCRCFEQIIKSLTSGKDCPLHQLRALAPRDQQMLVDLPNHTVTPFVDMPIQTFIAQQAEIEPERAAVIFHDRAYTRSEVERMACRIANLLCAAGVQPGGKVGLAMKRGPALVASMIGTLKAGCAYVPLLATFPEQRLRYMVETAQITHVLCDEATRAILPQSLGCTLVDVAGEAPNTFDPVPVKDEDLCNVLFTSGSTGKPKGVMLCHRSVSNMFMNMRQQLERADGPILCTTNLVFDTFVLETLLSLAVGKPLVMCDEEEMMLPWKLAELIHKNHVEIVQFTPARFQMCLSNEAFCEAAKELKLVLFGGELLTHLLLEQTCRTTDATTVNMYGPTEATVYMTMVDVRPGRPVSIGRPLQNGRIYVLDDCQRPVLPTAYGELWLSGEVLSAGYISRPDLTEGAFRPDPFFPGQRMYRTGDIARMRLDGSYDFQGRRDSQVKLNGQRVELDEITGAVMTSGCALLAATVPVRHEDGSMQLYCFYQKDPKGTGGEVEIRNHMRTVLPKYMLPSRIVELERMPQTASSKIDLRTLGELAKEYDSGREGTLPAQTESPAPVEEPPVREEPAEVQPIPEKSAEMVPVREMPAERPTAPAAEPVVKIEPVKRKCFAERSEKEVPAQSAPEQADALEQLLLEIWEQVLRRGNLAGNQSFFDQGGTSLAALSILSQYYNHQLELSLQEFYENPTAHAQAKLLASRRQSAVDAATTAETNAVVETAAPAVKPAVVEMPVKQERFTEQLAEESLTHPATEQLERIDGLEQLLLEIWEQVLRRGNLAGNQSFFDQGGTSLAALSILSQYYNHQLELSLQDFYENPTARAQAKLLVSRGQGIASVKENSITELTAPVTTTKIAATATPPAETSPTPAKASAEVQTPLAGEDPHYPRFVPALPHSRGRKRNIGTVLLTGATGFLGAHVLRELLDAGAEHVYCLIRGENPQRLWDTLSWYFGSGWCAGCSRQVEVLLGDITKAGLGLPPTAYQKLSGNLNAVWHCAADVRHYAADEEAYLAANLTGTENLIKLARAACVPLYHMSTESVSGQRLLGSDMPADFTEDDFDIGQDWRFNLYIRSKFLAENAVLEAVRAGLTARIFRLGRLVGRESDGTFQRNPESNAFWLLMRAVHKLGAIPVSMTDLPVDLTPIDWCAGAVVALRNAPMTVYHIQNPTPPTLEQTARAVVPQLEVLPDEAFRERVQQVLARQDGDVLGPLLDFQRRSLTAPPTIEVRSARTMEQLEAVGFHGPAQGPERTLRAFHFE